MGPGHSRNFVFLPKRWENQEEGRKDINRQTDTGFRRQTGFKYTGKVQVIRHSRIVQSGKTMNNE